MSASVTTTKSLPKNTYTSTATSIASTSSYIIPTIKPPSPDDNPYIWRSSAPSGTVFIAFGSAVGLFLVLFLLFLIEKKLNARKIAKSSTAIHDHSPYLPGHTPPDKSGGTFYSVTGQSSTNLNQSNIRIPLLNQTLTQEDLFEDRPDEITKQPEVVFSTLDDKRRSMFISPTAEVMNLNLNAYPRIYPDGAQAQNASPDRGRAHERKQSYDEYSSVQLASPVRSASSSPKRKSHRTAPSLHLESMFEE